MDSHDRDWARDWDRDRNRDGRRALARDRDLALERLIQERSTIAAEAPDQEPDWNRSLVYLRFEGVHETHQPALCRALERLAARLWGSAALVPLGSTEFALQLDGWSAVRCEQLGRLLENAFRPGLQQLGDDVQMRVCIAQVGRPHRGACR